jgi:hypothetical protein
MHARELALALLLASGCASPSHGERAALDVAPAREHEVAPSAQASLATYWVERRHERDDALDEAVGGSLWASWAPWTWLVEPAIEAGVGYSQHRVAGFRSAELELHRVCAGGKLVVGATGPVSLWTRAGWFYRWSWDPDFDEAPFDQDGGGTYFGFGLELAAGDCRVGPFYELHRGSSHDDLEERFYGLSLTFGR